MPHRNAVPAPVASPKPFGIHCRLYRDAREYYSIALDGTESPGVRVPFGMTHVDTAVIAALWTALETVPSPQERGRVAGIQLLP